MLCQTSIVYSRKIGEKTYSFGHEGVLYRRSFIMYDKQTESLWIHTTGEAVKVDRSASGRRTTAGGSRLECNTQYLEACTLPVL